MIAEAHHGTIGGGFPPADTAEPQVDLVRAALILGQAAELLEVAARGIEEYTGIDRSGAGDLETAVLTVDPVRHQRVGLRVAEQSIVEAVVALAFEGLAFAFFPEQPDQRRLAEKLRFELLFAGPVEVVGGLEALGIAPKGSKEVSQMLGRAAEALVAEGESEIFTPSYFFLARRKA